MSSEDHKQMPQRWKLEKGPDGAWNTAQMTTTEDGEWCKASDVTALEKENRRLLALLERSSRESQKVLTKLADERIRAVALEAECGRLRELLQEYGRHSEGCSGEFPPHRCKCGWERERAALAPQAGPPRRSAG